MTKFRMIGGAAVFGAPSLCVTCRRSTVVKGDAMNDRVLHCSAVDAQITFEVRDCNSYEDKSMPSLYDMRDSAWILRTDATKRKIGFVPYKDLKTSEQRQVDRDVERLE